MKRGTKRAYTPEFRVESVGLADMVGRTEATRQLGISIKTLSKWHRDRGPGKSVAATPMRLGNELQAENTRLRSALVVLRHEREILKKAAVYFAKESL